MRIFFVFPIGQNVPLQYYIKNDNQTIVKSQQEIEHEHKNGYGILKAHAFLSSNKN